MTATPSSNAYAVMAGHICLDIIPNLDRQTKSFEELLAPGNLLVADPAVLSTGGAVSNTGLALHRLGLPVRMMGKVGRDLFGEGIQTVLRRYGESLAEGMIVSDDPSSYTLVLNFPGVDRIFLHCPGANDTFCADDVDYAALPSARWFHFGYPTLMRRMFCNGGEEFEALMRRAKQAGPTTSVDLAWVDPSSQAGQTDWPPILRRTLPFTDVFLPSLDEIVYMLDRERFFALQTAGGGNILSQADGALLGETAGRLIDMGVAVVALKLGDQGLYLRTTDDTDRLRAMGPCAPADPSAWAGREMLAPCFRVQVAGTTGSGDCTIAGVLAGLLHGLSAELTLTAGVATGACNVEALDATSGIRPWDEMQARIAAGWDRRDVALALPGWRYDESEGLYHSPNDRAEK